jgi:hypothetical protein
LAKKKDAPDEAAEEEESQDAEGEDSGDKDGDKDGDKKDKKDKKKDKDKGKDEPPEEPSARAGYIGLGLVGSLIVGFDPLRDAFQGNGSFENAIFRFLACVAVCVVGAGTIGRMIDASAPDPEEANPDEVELDEDGNPILGDGDEAAGALEADNLGEDGQNGDGSEDAGDEGSAESERDKSETMPAGSASSDDGVRQDTERQPLTSSEEMSS